MTTHTTHTPLPWIWDEVWSLIKGPEGEEICAIHSGQRDTDRVNRFVAWENSQHIVHCVNTYPMLVEALEQAINTIKALDEDYDLRASYVDGRNALALARKEA